MTAERDREAQAREILREETNAAPWGDPGHEDALVRAMLRMHDAGKREAYMEARAAHELAINTETTFRFEMHKLEAALRRPQQRGEASESRASQSVSSQPAAAPSECCPDCGHDRGPTTTNISHMDCSCGCHGLDLEIPSVPSSETMQDHDRPSPAAQPAARARVAETECSGVDYPHRESGAARGREAEVSPDPGSAAPPAVSERQRRLADLIVQTRQDQLELWGAIQQAHARSLRLDVTARDLMELCREAESARRAQAKE